MANWKVTVVLALVVIVYVVISSFIFSAIDFGDSAMDFGESFDLCLQIITTIGYGNHTPVTVGGKVFCMFFALTGIPVNFWLFKLIGEHMLNGEKLAITKLEMKLFHRQPRYLAEKCVLVAVVVALVVILIGAAIQTSDEDWSFLHGVYFFVITMTTVGFGDLIPTHSLMSIKIFKILYSYFGLCVMSNILNAAFQVEESILFLKSKCCGLAQRSMIVNEESDVVEENATNPAQLDTGFSL